MKIDSRLNEEAGGGDQQPPWDPENPPFWWNPNTPIPPGYPQYPADRDGDGVISINEWLVWAENLMRAWAKENEDEGDPNNLTPRGRGVPEWVGRGSLPTHYDYNPWLILPVGGAGTGDLKTHPLYFLFLYYRDNYNEFREQASSRMYLMILRLLDTLMPGNYPLTMAQKMALAQSMTDPILVLFFGFTGDFDDFISMLRFFWNPHIPDSLLDRLGPVGDFFSLITRLVGINLEDVIGMFRILMLNAGGGLGEGLLGELLRAAGVGTTGIYSMPWNEGDEVPNFTPEGYLEGGTWFHDGENWYYLEPVNTFNPDMPPEVIDRPPKPELTPPPDPFQFPPTGGPISPLAQVEGEFAKAFARYNGNMQGKGIR